MTPFPLAPAPFTGSSRTVPLMNAFEWLRAGWLLFMGAPFIWLTLGFGIVFVWGAVDLLWISAGSLLAPSLFRELLSAFLLLGPVLLLPMATASGLIISQRLSRGETPDFSDLQAGFCQHPVRMLLVGAIYLGGWLGVYFIFALIKGPLALFLPTLAGFAFLMSIWFISPLVALHHLPPFTALRLGFAACATNMKTFAVFGFTMAVLHLLALLPLGLGFILLFPVVIAAQYASYRDIFSES